MKQRKKKGESESESLEGMKRKNKQNKVVLFLSREIELIKMIRILGFLITLGFASNCQCSSITPIKNILKWHAEETVKIKAGDEFKHNPPKVT